MRIAFCVRCAQIGVFASDDNAASSVNRENDLGSPGSRMLVALAKRLFPDDAEIQGIK